jgi:hypothetical protein
MKHWTRGVGQEGKSYEDRQEEIGRRGREEGAG